MNAITLEICAGSLRSAIAAYEGGADRIELCSALEAGGLTPSIGMVKEAVKLKPMKVQVLVRPRSGDFLYSEAEKREMLADVRAIREAGADGVVIGALTADGDVDAPFIKLLKEEAGEMSVTFHRAYDMLRSPEDALEILITLGCDRILTSGQCATAEEGVSRIAALMRQAKGRIALMPGGGITSANVLEILRNTGFSEVHSSARTAYMSQMRYKNALVNMGKEGVDEYILMETSAEKVSELKKIVGEGAFFL